MLDLNLIRENPDLVRTSLRNRQMDASPVDDILKLDEKRRALLTQVESLKAALGAWTGAGRHRL
jgi:seryl-tRNA synthetase